MTLQDIVRVIAETYRKDAEDNKCETCKEVFEFYGYNSAELKKRLLIR